MEFLQPPLLLKGVLMADFLTFLKNLSFCPIPDNSTLYSTKQVFGAFFRSSSIIPPIIPRTLFPDLNEIFHT